MPRPTPVVFLITGLGVGGAETQLVRVVTNLDHSRWQPTVVSMTNGGAFVDALQQAGVPVLTLGMSRGKPSLAALGALVRILKQRRAKALVCFMFHANLMGRLAGLISRVPVVISSVRTENFGGLWREIALRLTDRLGTITVTNSQLVADSLVRRGVIPDGRVTVIPNALPLDRAALSADERNRLRIELGLTEDSFFWLAVGRLDPAKDYPTLLKAFTTITRHHPEARLLVAGDGPLRESLEEQITQLQFADRVRLLGFRDDVPRLMGAADAYVLSSAWEGFPNGIIEAMAACKPVVATAVGGVPEVVADGVTGLLVEPGRPSDLANAMLRMMEMDEQSRLEMARRAHHQVLSRFGLQDVVRLWDKLLAECCGNVQSV